MIRNKKNKGQIEMFGLAFIVILISIGFFIYVSIKSQETTPTPQKDFTKDKLASDFILAIGEVSMENCEQYDLEDLIIDCAKNNRINCGENNSCITVNNSIALMLNSTFNVKGISYRFYSENLKYPSSSSKELLNFSYRNCTETSPQGKSGTRIIRLYPIQANVFLNLNICYK
jgi:hypothetical protein